MSTYNYQEAIDAAVASCCPTTEAFGAGEGEALESALEDAGALTSMSGWSTFAKKFLQGLADHLRLTPSVSFDKAAFLKLLTDWFNNHVRPYKFDWIIDSVEDVMKDLALSGLLLAAEFILDRYLP